MKLLSEVTVGAATGSTSTTTQPRAIIWRKLKIPEPGPGTVHRARIGARLRSLLEVQPTVTVCASAGSGKTTAVADAIDGLDRPVAWLSLDGTEKPAGRLLIYLEAAVAQHVASAGQVASDALRSNLHIGESAGLLAESVQGSGLVIICDNVEQIITDDGSVAVLNALARYLPDGVNLILISRQQIPLKSRAAVDSHQDHIDEEYLAFNVDEAAEALRLAGRTGIDAHEAVRRTQGWVSGVLFGNWDDEPDAQATGLHSFLASNILDTLDPAERSFLLHTSLLDEVTVPGAVALGESDAPQIMSRLRSVHLPVSWSRDDTRMTPHGQFREFLREVLGKEEPENHAMLQRRHADFLLGQGEHEEAVDALLRIGDIDNAWDRAAELLPDLVSRMDFAPAARWLDQLRLSSRCPTPQVSVAVLRVTFALEHFSQAAEMFDKFGYQWLPGPASADHEEAVVLGSWCLWHLGRVDQAMELAAQLPAGRPKSIVMMLMALTTKDAPEIPEPSSMPSGPLDGILLRCTYLRGRVTGLDEAAPFDPWRTILGAPWIVAGLRVTGRIDEATAMYELRRSCDQPLWLHAFDAVELMLDLGRGDEAWEALKKGRALINEAGSRPYRILSLVIEAKLWLRFHRDAEEAERALNAAEAAGLKNYAFAYETAQMWRGLSLLLRDRNAEAQEVLLQSVESMQASDRKLELPTAAAYLAEAHWRVGAESRSDAAAQLALDVSCAQGLQHLLLAALADVPDVATRSADASPSRMSRWREITSLLASQQALRLPARAPRVILEEFGEPTLTLDGQPVQPGLSKSIEMMSFLLGCPRYTATRQQLLDAVFDGRNDAASRSYLRQALFKLRAVLPEDLAPAQELDTFTIPVSESVVGTARTVVDLLALAARQPDQERLATLQKAIEYAARGPYLSTLTSEWIKVRRADIEEEVASARFDAARIAFRLSRYGLARHLLHEVLRQHPYREQAWQLAISVAHASGSDDAVLRIFRRYVAAMKELGVPPSAEVQRLVARLRR